MTDALQQSLHTAAANSAVLKPLAVFAGNYLIIVLAAAFAGLAWLNRERITGQVIARIAVSGLVSLVLVFILNHLIHDPRPFMVEHYTPLAHASADNGFPSDHTLAAALLTGWLLWFNRRWIPVFAVGLVAVLLGRLAIGAHHTLDVLGSLVIAAIGIGAASFLRLDARWQQPVLNLLGKVVPQR